MKISRILLGVLCTFGLLQANALKNVVLVLNYNHAHYESIPLIREMYGPYFDNILFYGPEEHPDVNLCRHNKGYWSYMAIVDAMQKHPDAPGYLFLHDDCVLNAWLMKSLDTRKIWYSDISFIKESRGNALDITKGAQGCPKWDWWVSEWGWQPTAAAFNELPAHYKRTLASNWGENHVVAAYADLAYIPAAYKNQFIELAMLFGKHKSFLEIALPTMVSCLAPKSEWVWLAGYGTSRRGFDFQPDAFFNHPVKLSDPTNREILSSIFKQHISH